MKDGKIGKVQPVTVRLSHLASLSQPSVSLAPAVASSETQQEAPWASHFSQE